MKKSEFKIFYIEIFLLLVFIFNIFVLNFFNDYTLPLLLILVFILLIIFLGYEKDSFKRTKDILLTVLIYVISYYLFIYIVGIFLGFLRSGYSLKIVNIIKNVFPVLLVQISKELLRYQINLKGEKKKLILILSIIVFVLVDVSSVLFLYDLSNPQDILKLIEITIFPAIADNILMTYISIKAGYKVCIIYQLLMKLPQYIVPIIPDLGDYLDIIFRMILPCLVLYTIIVTNKDKRKEKDKANLINKNRIMKISYVASIILLIIVVYLTSGIFTYYAITIGSGSMEPKISKGDITIVKKIKDVSSLQLGDVLVYEKEQKVVVHRIVDIKQQNNQFIFTTKGDANNDDDNYPVYESDVIGIVKFKIKFLGYPTIWLSELIN